MERPTKILENTSTRLRYEEVRQTKVPLTESEKAQLYDEAAHERRILVALESERGTLTKKITKLQRVIQDLKTRELSGEERQRPLWTTSGTGGAGEEDEAEASAKDALAEAQALDDEDEDEDEGGEEE
jgi:hypothetical protein